MTRDAVGLSRRVLSGLRTLAPVLDDRAYVSAEEAAAVSQVRALLAEWALQDRNLRT